MKKPFNKRVIYILLLICLGCYENEITLNNTSNNDIQNWFNTLYPEGLLIRSSENVPYYLPSSPLWNEQRQDIKDYVVAHQFPLSLPGLLQAMPLDNYDLPKSRSSSFLSLSSFTHLVILDNHTTDEKIGFLMTVLPSEDYYNQYGLSEETFNYFERPVDYDGYVFYHHLTGEFSNGWKYTQGEITHTVMEVLLEEGEKSPLTRNSYDCYWNGTVFLILDCQDAYAGTPGHLEYKGTYCQVVDIQTVYTYTCENVSEWGGGGGGEYDPGSGGGSSGSGNDNNNQGNKMSEKTAKLAAKHSLGDSIKKFNEALEKALEDCGYETLYNYVVSGGKITEIIIDPNLEGDASFSNQERLKFRNYSNITTSNIKHEMVHIFQKRYNNIESFDKRMEGMIEFEVQFLQDIHEFIKIGGNENAYFNIFHQNIYIWGGYGLGEVGKEGYLKKYYNYLSDLTNKGTVYPSSISNDLFLEISHYFGEICLSYASKYGYQYGLSDYKHCMEKMMEIIDENCKK